MSTMSVPGFPPSVAMSSVFSGSGQHHSTTGHPPPQPDPFSALGQLGQVRHLVMFTPSQHRTFTRARNERRRPRLTMFRCLL